MTLPLRPNRLAPAMPERTATRPARSLDVGQPARPRRRLGA